MENVSIVGLDVAKNSFHAHGAAEDGSKVFSKALPRGRVLEFFGQIERCTVAMEGRQGLRHWFEQPLATRERIPGAGSFPSSARMSG